MSLFFCVFFFRFLLLFLGVFSAIRCFPLFPLVSSFTFLKCDFFILRRVCLCAHAFAISFLFLFVFCFVLFLLFAAVVVCVASQNSIHSVHFGSVDGSARVHMHSSFVANVFIVVVASWSWTFSNLSKWSGWRTRKVVAYEFNYITEGRLFPSHDLTLSGVHLSLPLVIRLLSFTRCAICNRLYAHTHTCDSDSSSNVCCTAQNSNVLFVRLAIFLSFFFARLRPIQSSSKMVQSMCWCVDIEKPVRQNYCVYALFRECWLPLSTFHFVLWWNESFYSVLLFFSIPK